MTVESTVSQVAFDGNGSTTVFSIPFVFLQNSDIAVEITVGDTPSTATDYTITGAGSDSGGLLTFTNAPVAGSLISISRQVPITQLVEYQSNSAFPAATTEKALDKLTMIAQQLSEGVNRAIQFPEEQTTFSPILPIAASRERTVVGFDTSGGLQLYPLSASVGAGDLKTDTFSAGTDFTAGTTTSLTLSRAPGSVANVSVHYDGVYQGPEGIESIDALVITFTQAIPEGVEKVYVTTGTTISVGTVADESIDDAKIYPGSKIYWRITDTIDVYQFGAVGDGVADDTAAITSAMTYALAQDRPQSIYFRTGLFKITAPLPTITKPLTMYGDNSRNCQLLFSGAVNCLKVSGTATRASDVYFRNITFNGNNMTADYAVVLDYVQSVTFDLVSFNNPWNGISIRQAGVISFNEVTIDTVRGTNGLYALGTNTARNNENDQIDIIMFRNVVMQSSYVEGSATPASNADLVMFDGRIQTIQFAGLRLLNARRGLVALNSYGLANNLVPRFFTGFALEVESMYSHCIELDAGVDFWCDNIFAAGSAVGNGIVLSSTVGNFVINKGSLNSNALCGIDVNGAQKVSINDVTIFNNSLVSGNVKSGIFISGSGLIAVRGGLSGKAGWMPAYTEPQKYGIDIDSGFTGILQVDGTDLRGNSTGTMYTGANPATGSKVANCPGFNPKGVSTVSVGSSPFTYTSGFTEENISIYDGTAVVAMFNNVAISKQSPANFTIPPRSSIVISFSSAPTIVANAM